jgi:hypothetical protein
MDAELKSQIERLEAARRDAALVASVPRVVAAAFGVLPLCEAEGGALEVAAVESASPRALAALPRVLGRPVRAVPFGDALIHVYLKRIYLRDDAINFHTFETEDFLARDDLLPLLGEEKENEPVRPHVRPDPERLVLLDYAYRSELRNLDAPAGAAPFHAGETDLPFDFSESQDGGPLAVVHRREELPPAVLILARESYSLAGMEHAHGWRGHEVRKLPFFIHPTELQITGVEACGTLHFYLYDRIEKVKPGGELRYDVTYHFLSMGQRLRRHLALRVYRIASVPRGRVRRTVDALGWKPEHLERWLGFDMA